MKTSDARGQGFDTLLQQILSYPILFELYQLCKTIPLQKQATAAHSDQSQCPNIKVFMSSMLLFKIYCINAFLLFKHTHIHTYISDNHLWTGDSAGSCFCAERPTEAEHWKKKHLAIIC